MLLTNYLSFQVLNNAAKSQSDARETSFRNHQPTDDDSRKTARYYTEVERYIKNLDGYYLDDTNKYVKSPNQKTLDEKIKSEKDKKKLFQKIFVGFLVLAIAVSMPLLTPPPGGESVLQSLYPDPKIETVTVDNVSKTVTTAAPIGSMVAYNFLAITSILPIIGVIISAGLIAKSIRSQEILIAKVNIKNKLKSELKELDNPENVETRYENVTDAVKAKTKEYYDETAQSAKIGPPSTNIILNKVVRLDKIGSIQNNTKVGKFNKGGSQYV